MKPPLGIIGMGLMGSALASRLESHFELVTCDSRLGGDPGNVINRCERVILSLPDSQVVTEVMKEAEPLLRAGQIIIDTTTGSPQDAEALGSTLAALGVSLLDATISGSSVQVRDGSCTFMAGGSAAAFERCQDIFAAVARHVFHVGGTGAGSRMKLVTNLVLGLNRAALAEALVFATEMGFDPRLALDVMQHSPAASRIMEAKGMKMIEGDFTPHARLSQHLKDVRLILASASKTLPLSETHRQLLERAEALGLGDLDNSAIIRAYE